MIDNAWVCKRTQVAELILLAGDELPQDTAHDLARARLRQVPDEVDFLWCCEGTDDLADLEDELLLEDLWVRGVVLEFAGGGSRKLTSDTMVEDTYGLSVTKAWTA